MIRLMKRSEAQSDNATNALRYCSTRRNTLSQRNITFCFISNSLSEELLAKETLSLPDIMRILGDRPYPLKDSIKEYLCELEDRQQKEDQKKKDKQQAQTTGTEGKKEEGKKEEEQGGEKTLSAKSEDKEKKNE